MPGVCIELSHRAEGGHVRVVITRQALEQLLEQGRIAGETGATGVNLTLLHRDEPVSVTRYELQLVEE